MLYGFNIGVIGYQKCVDATAAQVKKLVLNKIANGFIFTSSDPEEAVYHFPFIKLTALGYAKLFSIEIEHGCSIS